MLTSQCCFWVRIIFFKMWSSLCEACLPLTLTWLKLNVRPEVSTEPTHFLTLMNYGKVFSSLDGITCSYQCSDQFHFLPGYGIGFLETLKNPANLLSITPGIIWSLKLKKKRIVELLIPTFFKKKKAHEGTKTFLDKEIMGRLF